MNLNIRHIIKTSISVFRDNGGILGLSRYLTVTLKHNGFKYLYYKTIIKYSGPLIYQDWISRFEKNEIKYYENQGSQAKASFTIVLYVADGVKSNHLMDYMLRVKNCANTAFELVLLADCKKTLEEIKACSEAYDINKCLLSISLADSYKPKLINRWVIPLTTNTLLHPLALHYISSAISENKKIRFIYTDDDLINKDNVRFSPRFKPGWNPDYFYSSNYIGDFSVYDGETLLKTLNGESFKVLFHDRFRINLNLTSNLCRNSIHHIPKILAHIETHSNSNSDLIQSRRQSLAIFFQSLNIDANVQALPERNCLKYNVKIPEKTRVTIIIPTKDALEITRQAINSIIEKTDYNNFEILLVDNNSTNPEALDYFELLNRHEKCSVLKYPKPFNYSAINNFAVQHALGDYVLLLNNDVEVINREWLKEMLSHAIRPDIGCVGAKLLYPNETIQHAGIVTGLGGVAGHPFRYQSNAIPGYMNRLQCIQNYSAVTAACLLVKKSIYHEVGGLDETNLAVAFNDVDFCLKVRDAGYFNLWTPDALLYHHESVSRGKDDVAAKRKRFNKEVMYMKRRWKSDCYNDDMYSPNLTVYFEDFSLAFPPRKRDI